MHPDWKNKQKKILTNLNNSVLLKPIGKTLDELENILVKYKIEKDKIKLIINDYITKLIPAGTKGVIKGNKFNFIIKKFIINMKLDVTQFDIMFEKKCEDYLTDEIPDWYIQRKSDKKVIIGMNQLDLWSGGQQFNRGYKYLVDNKINTENCKLLCIVCNNIVIKSTTNKTYKLIDHGFNNNTLCYIKNLPNILYDFFKIEHD